jgi:hypothetical protein
MVTLEARVRLAGWRIKFWRLIEVVFGLHVFQTLGLVVCVMVARFRAAQMSANKLA